ncbi:M28 family metallopeptidase [Bailinhaonella thermotolerans]|uniref:M28 family peptidase n=1 Tax=Bailinhaonella thermotolerans TaxID=1070861 RepID=A0A3A4AB16_9ACTN|nr:M28 family metallopeptidase [Bailinhaonella thermotolerans]RJL22713.1 M28 family peptidase [Bailinhaonella thermotolerans]
MRSQLRKGAVRAAILASALSLPLSTALPVSADPDPAALAQQVRTQPVKRHLEAFQKIAEANGGNRAAGTPGYDASRDYVAAQLKRAGYDVTLQAFQFPFFQELSTAAMEQVSPEPKTYRPTPPDGSSIGDFATMTYSGSGDVTATVQGVDLVLPPPPAPGSTSGCEASDFAGFTPGNIALIQRGTCTFQVKAENAQAAGAAGVIIFNEGQPGRTDTLTGTLGAPTVRIPVVGASFAVGEDLNTPAGTRVHLRVQTTSEVRTTHNVIAESKRGDANKVVMLGAHLDSVLAGPGINDNGSGSAGLLETAIAMGKLPPRNKLRFAFWGAEELGLLGSEHYVGALSEAERAKIKLYLNFDMIGSPNYILGVYDGDDSDQVGAPAGPPGSDEIEKNFEKYFDAAGTDSVGTDFTGRSDYGPFIAVGIPAGGLFTGAEEIKTPEQAAKFGGQAGVALDPCYHQACDTIKNISDKALLLNTGAILHSAALYAFSRDLPGPDARAAVKAKAAAADGHDDHDHGRADR